MIQTLNDETYALNPVRAYAARDVHTVNAAETRCNVSAFYRCASI